MKRIRIIAAISAVATALAVYLYLSSVQKPVDIERAPVVLAMAKIAAGQEIKAEMVEVKDLPVEAIHLQAARSADEVVGRIASAQIEPGEQMMIPRFFKAGESSNTLAYAVEKGKRAFTVAVDAVSGIAGLVKPRDHVDVLIIVGVSQGSLQPQEAQIVTTYSEILLQDILVLATNQAMQEGGVTDGAAVETVTLSVTPDQAVQLNLAASEGKIRLVLRSPVDTETKNVNPLQVKQLIE